MIEVNQEEGASTAPAEPPPPDSAATALNAPIERPVRIARPGRFLAGIVLTTALGIVPPSPMESFTVVQTRRRHDANDAATELQLPDRSLIVEAGGLFERGADEFFEDGVQSQFARALLLFIQEHGNAALSAIARYLYSDDVNPDVVSESLRWLAEIDDASSLPDRWTILQTMLRSSSPRIRDGAILGFAILDDVRAAPLLASAQNVEQIAELRRLISDVLRQLNE